MALQKLIYDGSFEGLLTAIFIVYEEQLDNAEILEERFYEPDFFAEAHQVYTDDTKAARVWEGLRKFSQFSASVYRSFLTEFPDKEIYILDAVRYVLKTKNDKDFGQPSVLKLAQLTKQVGREKHRMEAFVRFKRTKDDLYVALIEPDFNVLPLISSHFKKRYADQEWLIYDVKRHYGISYNLKEVSVVDFEFHNQLDVFKTSTDFFALEEIEFQTLWQSYFKSVTIASRKNLKLHTQHVPKRYWKYLSEKQQ